MNTTDLYRHLAAGHYLPLAGLTWPDLVKIHEQEHEAVQGHYHDPEEAAVRLERVLIISAGGETRVVHHMPALRLDEFAYRLVITIPDAWASVLGEINVSLPDPDPTVELDSVEPEEEAE